VCVCVCVLLANATLVVEKGAMSTLLSISVRPTELEEFKSLAQLERRQDRLLELIYQHGVGMDREEVGPQQLSQAEFLEFNPFKASSISPFIALPPLHSTLNAPFGEQGQPVNLPSAFDRSSARAVGFIGGQMRTLVGRADPTSQFDCVGLARANFAIPNSLPAFYFEVRFLKDESFKGSIEAQLLADAKDEGSEGASANTPSVSVDSPSSEETPNKDNETGEPTNNSAEKQERKDQPTGLNIGVGLYREGIILEGAPGEHNSYAYVVSYLYSSACVRAQCGERGKGEGGEKKFAHLLYSFLAHPRARKEEPFTMLAA